LETRQLVLAGRLRQPQSRQPFLGSISIGQSLEIRTIQRRRRRSRRRRKSEWGSPTRSNDRGRGSCFQCSCESRITQRRRRRRRRRKPGWKRRDKGCGQGRGWFGFVSDRARERSENRAYQTGRRNRYQNFGDWNCDQRGRL